MRLRYSLLGATVLAAVGGAAGVWSALGSTAPHAVDREQAARTGPGVAEARRIVAKAQSAQGFAIPGPPFDATKAKGKNMWYIVNSLTTPFSFNVTKGLKQAMKTVGVKVTAVDGKGQVSEYARGIESAIGAKANLIGVHGVPYQLLKAPVADAAKAHIPVIFTLDWSPGTRPADVPKSVVAGGSHSYVQAGKWMGDWIVADANGKAVTVAIITASDTGPPSAQIAAGVKGELRRLCSGCKVVSADSRVAQWSQLGTLVPSLLRKNPDIKYVLPVFDGMALFVVPGLQAANATNRVCIVSFNGTPSMLNLLRKGNRGVCADVGVVQIRQGWAIADQALRILTGNRPVAKDDIKATERLFTKANIKTINLKAPESSWYSKVDFRAAYAKLWKVK